MNAVDYVVSDTGKEHSHYHVCMYEYVEAVLCVQHSYCIIALSAHILAICMKDWMNVCLHWFLNGLISSTKR